MGSLTLITTQLLESKQVLSTIIKDNLLLSTIDTAATAIYTALENGNKLLLIGNGGSAADAQHIAGEYVSRFNFDRSPLPAIALTVDTSILTAIGNDYGFDKVFSRQVQALGNPGDILIAYSTSGNSPNIIEAINIANNYGLITIGFTGSNNGKIDQMCNHLIAVPSVDTPRIQEMHAIIGHIICGIVENYMFLDDE